MLRRGYKGDAKSSGKVDKILNRVYDPRAKVPTIPAWMDTIIS